MVASGKVHRGLGLERDLFFQTAFLNCLNYLWCGSITVSVFKKIKEIQGSFKYLDHLNGNKQFITR